MLRCVALFLGRPEPRAWPSKRIRRVVYGALAFVVLCHLVVPEPGYAQNPLTLIPDVVVRGAESAMVKGFQALLEWLFGDIEDLAKNLVKLMLAVPLLTDTKQFGRLNEYRVYVTWAAWGVLPLSLVVSLLRYWMSGLVGNGAYEAILGVVRVAGAVAGILAFPYAFDIASRMVNELTVALVTNPIVGSGLVKTAGPFAAFVAVGSVISSGGLALIVVLVGIVLMLILLVVKVIVVALLAVLFVGASLAMSFWPVEELGFLLRSLLQGILGCFAFPITWALTFGVFSVLSPDAMFGTGSNALVNGLLAPLVGLASLIIAYKLPFVVMRQAMQAGLMPSTSRGVRNAMLYQRVGGGGLLFAGAMAAGGVAGGAAGRAAGAAASQHDPRWATMGAWSDGDPSAGYRPPPPPSSPPRPSSPRGPALGGPAAHPEPYQGAVEYKRKLTDEEVEALRDKFRGVR